MKWNPQKKTPEEERNQKCLPATWIEGKKLRARSSLRIMVLRWAPAPPPREAQVWGELKTDLSDSTRHPRPPPPTYFSRGTWSRDSNLKHFTQDITLFWWLLTFPLLLKANLFLSLKQSISHSLMVSWKSCSVEGCRGCEKRVLEIWNVRVDRWDDSKRGGLFIRRG